MVCSEILANPEHVPYMIECSCISVLCSLTKTKHDRLMLTFALDALLSIASVRIRVNRRVHRERER